MQTMYIDNKRYRLSINEDDSEDVYDMKRD